MSNANAHREPPASARPSGKPSLMEGPATARVATKVPAENLRMLVELESSAHAAKRGPARSASTWVSAVALLIAAAGGAWWWNQQRSPAAPDQPAVRLSVAATAATPAAPPAAPPDATATQAALPASGAVEAAPAAARIETVADSGAAPRAEMAAAPAAIAAAVPSAIAAKTPARVASVAKAPRRASSPTTVVRTAKAKTSIHAKATSSRKAVILPVRTAAVAPTLIGRSEPGAAGAGSAGGAGGAGGVGRDPDIVLLTALLAHVSRDAQGAPRASQADLTIAQVVQRCEARGGADSPEARDCRRRICEGYWGKAQACPARLAPKRD